MLRARAKLGPYEIVAALGAGGMGEVYRARDTKLGREVALKVLPEEFAADAERMARFRREAQLLASLDHPNIAAIYGFEDSTGTHTLVMELVEGPTLAERIAKGPIPLDEALPIAKQIAEGLEYAHERGIAHRDLKPSNIKLAANDAVKILDFGLAKALEGDAASMDISSSPTISRMATQAGIILGTAAYMSPEQAKGKSVDRRTDIWSFGCVLYEMLTGKMAFSGETITDVLAAVVMKDPDCGALPVATPLPLRELLQRCLTKDARERLQVIGEARIALQRIVTSDTELATSSTLVLQPPARVPFWRRALPWAALAAVAIVGAFAAYLLFKEPAPAERMEFAIPVQSEVSSLALSADGRMLALVERDDSSGENMLYFERLGAASATRLDATEGAAYPFWSPDDKNVGFFANGELQRISVSGGPPQVIVSASHGRGGTWGSQGVIIYAPDTGGPLWRVDADGSGAAPLTDKSFLPGEASHRWPEFLPDGNHFLFLASDFGNQAPHVVDGIYISSLSSQSKKLVFPEDSNFCYAHGHLYYEDERNNLAAVPFGVSQEKATGNPVIIAQHVVFQTSVVRGMFTAGGSDTVVYSTSSDTDASVLEWAGASGKELQHVGGDATQANPSISPDGNRAVVDIADPKSNAVNIWIEDLVHDTASRFTFGLAEVEDATAVWSRDGRMIAYRTNGYAGAGSIMVKPASGLGAAREIYRTKTQDDILPNSWSPDGKSLLCIFEPVSGGSRLVLVDVATGKLTPFLANKASVTNGMTSADGKWVAYASNETGTWEIYVTTFPGAQGKWQLSRAGGTEPRWRANGKEIYYIDPKGMLTAVAINTQRTFSAGTPMPLFALHARQSISNTGVFSYDVSKDGRSFLVNRAVKPDHVAPLTVVLDATARLGD